MAKVTYQRMFGVLETLGFAREPTKGRHLFFRHKSTGTVVALPPGARTKLVPPANLAAIRMTVIGREVARQDEIDHLLEAPRRQTA